MQAAYKQRFGEGDEQVDMGTLLREKDKVVNGAREADAFINRFETR